MRASPQRVPTAKATKNRKISSYATDFTIGTTATPVSPQMEIIVTQKIAYNHAGNTIYQFISVYLKKINPTIGEQLFLHVGLISQLILLIASPLVDLRQQCRT